MSRPKVKLELTFQVGQVRVTVRLMKGSLTKGFAFVVTHPELSIGTGAALGHDGYRSAQESYRSRHSEGRGFRAHG
jgi:hypothetical protein